RRPVRARLHDVSLDVLFPAALHGLRIYEVEAAVHDAPRFGIGVRGIAAADGPGAVAAELRRVALGILDEARAIGRRGELPDGVVPPVFVFRIAPGGRAAGDVGDGVIPSDG